ncbi:hypothetical protein [Streptomyces sp. NPDC007205]|uniref:hypothetical protein n=1 Tax=Streptomyces sp. NPDC007205 TaxID=3154316 RepID=UPI0033E184A7
MWRPADRASLLNGLKRQKCLAHTVLWLNELQRYLYTPHAPEQGEQAAAALTDFLHTAGRGPALIVGTLWRDPLRTLSTPSKEDPHQNARALLRSGTVIPVAEDFDEAALADLRRLAVHDARLAEALGKGGTRITQYLAGAQELLRLYAQAPVEALAVLDAAADARRLGVSEPLPEEFLRTAAAAYLNPDHWRTQDDHWRATWFTRALTYTGQPSHGIPGPLTRELPLPGSPAIGLSVYRLADYLAQDRARARCKWVPPEGFWTAAADHLHGPEGLKSLGQAARFRLRLRHADLLYRRAADAGAVDALYLLAHMRGQMGDREGAERITWEAADRADGGELYDLTVVRTSHGDWEGAERLARRAAIAGFPAALWHVAFAHARGQTGDHDAIERMVREAIRAGYDYALRRMEWDGGIQEVVAHLLKSASEIDHLLRVARDCPEEVERWAQEMVEGGHGMALQGLVRARKKLGDWDGAERAAFQARDAGAPDSLYELAVGCRKAGHRDSAERLFRAAADEGHAGGLGIELWLAELAGDQEEAKSLARQSADIGDPRDLEDLAEVLDDEWAEQLRRYGLKADGSVADPWWGPEASDTACRSE